MLAETKVCSKCGGEFPKSGEFFAPKKGQCRRCVAEWKKNKEKIQKQRKELNSGSGDDR